ncbi:response regulator [Sphingomonas sp.]|uniref:response regulator n=1 Tax=Sphingomonas sp. TaxID=28214 RepID=UPI0035B3D529
MASSCDEAHDDLTGKRILIVEDEYYIASDLKRALQQAGASVVGPVGDLRRGLALAGQEPLDAAVLDVNLQESASFPIADALDRRSVPYMFLTGYDAWALPTAYAGAPRLIKPIGVDAVLSEVQALIRQPQG